MVRWYASMLTCGLLQAIVSQSIPGTVGCRQAATKIRQHEMRNGFNAMRICALVDDDASDKEVYFSSGMDGIILYVLSYSVGSCGCKQESADQTVCYFQEAGQYEHHCTHCGGLRARNGEAESCMPYIALT